MWNEYLGGYGYGPLGPFCYNTGVFPGVPGPTPPINQYAQPYSYQSQHQCVPGGNQRTFNPSSGGESEKSKFSRLLQPVLSRTETERHLEGYTRPFEPKPTNQKVQVQNGVCRNNQESAGGSTVGNVHRSQTCVLSLPSEQETQEISEVFCKWANSAVQGSADGSALISLGIHSSNQTSSEVCKATGNQVNPVLGRLANNPREPADSDGTHSSGCATNGKSGLLDQSGEVRVSAKAIHTILGDANQFQVSDGGCHRQQVSTLDDKGLQSSESTSVSGKTLGETSGHLQINVHSDSVRCSKSQTSSMVLEGSLAPEVHASNISDNADRQSSTTDNVVDEKGSSVNSRTFCSKTSPNVNLYGCLDGGLGGGTTTSNGQSSVVGEVVVSGEASPHQHVRAESCESGIKRSSEVDRKQIHHGGVRQLDCSLLSQQAGGNQVEESLFRSSESTELDRETGHQDKSKTFTREVECGSRHAVKNGPDFTNGMVSSPISISDDLSEVGDSSHRLICNREECQASCICVSGSESKGACDRCSELELGGMFAYAYPPTAILKQVLQKIREDSCHVILIAPYWPAQVWFVDLMELSGGNLMKLPQVRYLLSQPLTGAFHRNLEHLDLAAWNLLPIS